MKEFQIKLRGKKLGYNTNLSNLISPFLFIGSLNKRKKFYIIKYRVTSRLFGV